MQNNKETVMQKVNEKIGTKAIEELLCLPPNEEPPQDLASIIASSVIAFVMYFMKKLM